MNTFKLKEFENKLIIIGEQISFWRNDKEAREVLEPLAFKTNADLKAHQLLTSLINSCFPMETILSEEDPNQDKFRPSNYWLIDPIDGTASWFGGFSGFVTQVAYIENGEPIYGAVYAPALKKLWTALKGNGAWLNGTMLPKLKPNNRLNLIDNYPEPKCAAEIITKALPISRYIECGSLGLKSCMVIDGTADLFVKDVLFRDWDIAPSAVLINEVGGMMSDLKGIPIDFSGPFEKNNGLIVARDKNLANLAIEIIAAAS